MEEADKSGFRRESKDYEEEKDHRFRTGKLEIHLRRLVPRLQEDLEPIQEAALQRMIKLLDEKASFIPVRCLLAGFIDAPTTLWLPFAECHLSRQLLFD